MLQKFKKALNSGTISLVVLSLLSKAEKPMYGYSIAKILDVSSDSGEPPVKQGTLYPILRSLEKMELLSSNVEPSVAGPPRKYYSITELGNSELKLWKDSWISTRDFVDRILENNIKIDAGSN